MLFTVTTPFHAGAAARAWAEGAGLGVRPGHGRWRRAAAAAAAAACSPREVQPPLPSLAARAHARTPRTHARTAAGVGTVLKAARGGASARSSSPPTRTSVPLPVVAALAVLAFVAGATLSRVPELPSASQAGRRARAASTLDAVAHAALQAPNKAKAALARAQPGVEGVAAAAAPSADPGGALAGGLHGVSVEGKAEYRVADAVGATGNNYLSVYPFQVLSWSPRAVYYPGFANASICDEIIEMSERRMGPSGLALKKGDTKEGTRDIRTSSGTFIGAKKDGTGPLSWVERKISEVTGVPSFHGEAFNVLRYELGQHYDQHYDTFDPAVYGAQSSQRIYSFLLYLSDGVEGGETIFPLNDEHLTRSVDYKSCDVGLKVKPGRGDALLFHNVHPNGTFDKASLHGGCPVQTGTKWVATKWVRDKGHGKLKEGPFEPF